MYQNIKAVLIFSYFPEISFSRTKIYLLVSVELDLFEQLSQSISFSRNRVDMIHSRSYK